MWNNHPDNGILTQKQQNIHGAVQNLPGMVMEVLNHTLFQNNTFSLFLFVQH
jgi:hypothetical protein